MKLNEELTSTLAETRYLTMFGKVFSHGQMSATVWKRCSKTGRTPVEVSEVVSNWENTYITYEEVGLNLHMFSACWPHPLWSEEMICPQFCSVVRMKVVHAISRKGVLFIHDFPSVSLFGAF